MHVKHRESVTYKRHRLKLGKKRNGITGRKIDKFTILLYAFKHSSLIKQ